MTVQELNSINRFVDPLAPGAHKALYELLWSGTIGLVVYVNIYGVNYQYQRWYSSVLLFLDPDGIVGR